MRRMRCVGTWTVQKASSSCEIVPGKMSAAFMKLLYGLGVVKGLRGFREGKL